MPYKLKVTKKRKKAPKYGVKNVRTGRIKSKDIPKTRAKRQKRLLTGLKRGWQPTGAVATDLRKARKARKAKKK